MRRPEAFTRLRQLHRPVFESAEASAALRLSPTATATMLARLADDALVVKLRHGLWALPEAWGGRVDPLDVLPVITRPYPSYASMWTALSAHGMIEQVPRGVYGVSVDRARHVETSIGTFHLHAVTPALYGGMADATGARAGLATPEKSMFDTVYLLVAEKGRASLPEIDLPAGFDEDALFSWVDRITSRRLATLVDRNLHDLLRFASRPDDVQDEPAHL